MMSVNMKTGYIQLAAVFCLLAGLALFLAPQALREGNTMRFIVLIAAAVLLWGAAQRKHV